MATNKDFLNYLSERIGTSDVKFRPMMGEYLVYYKGRLIGDVCDNRLLIKPVDAAKRILPNAQMQAPYDGAKPMILVEEPDDGEFLLKLFEEIYPELPKPKPRNKKVQK